MDFLLWWPGWSPVTLNSWYSYLWVVPSHNESGLACVINRIEQKWYCLTSDAGSQKASQLLLCSLGLLSLGKASSQPLKTFKELCAEAHVERKRGFLPTAITNLPIMKVSHLGSISSSTSQAIRWLQPWELTVISSKTLRQNYLAKLVLNSWTIEIMSKNKLLLLNCGFLRVYAQ